MTNGKALSGEMLDGVDPDSRASAPFALVSTGSSTVRALVTADEAAEEWRRYIEICHAILDDTEDYQDIGRKRFKKKSAWRKLAKAFDVSDAILEREVQRRADGYPVYAAITVEATYKLTGRTSIGYHECHVAERCCPRARGGECPNFGRSWHTCCQANCDGSAHWSHPGDVVATAHTRAKNRAIADLIGAGEVSAEEFELDGLDAPPPPTPPTPPPPPPDSDPSVAVAMDPAADKARRAFYATAKDHAILNAAQIHDLLGLKCTGQHKERSAPNYCDALRKAIDAEVTSGRSEADAWDLWRDRLHLAATSPR